MLLRETVRDRLVLVDLLYEVLSVVITGSCKQHQLKVLCELVEEEMETGSHEIPWFITLFVGHDRLLRWYGYLVIVVH